MQLYIDPWSAANGLAQWSGIWKEHDWKTINKEIWQRGMWIDFRVWAKNVKEFVVSYVNAHQRVTSTDEDFSNQVDRTCSVDTNEPLSPAT